MTALIQEENRKCDSSCHDAESPKCDCICLGKNHGVGSVQANYNVTGQLSLIKEYEMKIGQRAIIVQVSSSLIEAVIKHGTNKTEVIDGIPEDAILTGTFYDHHTDTINLKFSHDSFSVIPEGGKIPYVTPVLRTIKEQ